jgi:hypothetical protein
MRGKPGETKTMEQAEYDLSEAFRSFWILHASS